MTAGYLQVEIRPLLRSPRNVQELAKLLLWCIRAGCQIKQLDPLSSHPQLKIATAVTRLSTMPLPKEYIGCCSQGCPGTRQTRIHNGRSTDFRPTGLQRSIWISPIERSLDGVNPSDARVVSALDQPFLAARRRLATTPQRSGVVKAMSRSNSPQHRGEHLDLPQRRIVRVQHPKLIGERSVRLNSSPRLP